MGLRNVFSVEIVTQCRNSLWELQESCDSWLMHWVISWPDFCSRLWKENFLEMWPVSLALITHLSQIQPVMRQGSNKKLPYKDRLRINIFLSLHVIPFICYTGSMKKYPLSLILFMNYIFQS